MRRLIFFTAALVCLSFIDAQNLPVPTPPTPPPPQDRPEPPLAPAPTTPKPLPPGVSPLLPASAGESLLCFCADSVTGLQGCGVGAVQQISQPDGTVSAVCTNTQTEMRPVESAPDYEHPEACTLESMVNGEIRRGYVQCIHTGTLKCQ